jgi:hypothetical protein
MKTTVLAMILACALTAGAQDAAQSQTQPSAGGGGQQAAPEIKDPNEYNAYVGAIQQQDPNAKISALEAFLTQYPNSVMKTTALEQLMNTYLQAGNQAKVVDTAKRVLTADSCNLRALALLTYLSRQSVASGQNTQQSLADLTQYSNKGLECSSSGQKPAGLSPEEIEKLKKQTAIIFNGGAGFAALQSKDYAHAQTYLKAAVDAEPNDLQNVYPLATSYLSDPKAAPPDSDKLGEKGLCYIARAANLATGAGQAQIQDYGRKKYKNYHGSEEGWNGVLFATKSAPFTCPSIAIYVPPTPAQQAHDIVKDKTPDQIKQLSFGEWELVLSAGSPEDQEKVWNVIKGVPLQMEGTVVGVHDVGDGATKTTELQIAASEDDIEKKQADITLTMTGAIPPRMMPKVGDTLDFEGMPVDYTSPVHAASATTPAPSADSNAAAPPTAGGTGAAQATPGAATPAPAAAPAPGAPPPPFMMTMEKGKLLQKAGTTPAKKPPAHRRPTTRKPQ